MSDVHRIDIEAQLGFAVATSEPRIEVSGPIVALEAVQDHFRSAVDRNPQDPELWVSLGAVLEAAGSWADAAISYRNAIALEPTASGYLKLGLVLKLDGQLLEAIEAFGHALVRDSSLVSARLELIALGVQHPIVEEGAARDVRWGHLDASAGLNNRTSDPAADQSLNPMKSYNQFRHRFPISAPPDFSSTGSKVAILVDARGAAPALLRATLRSLTNQSFRDWQAIVVAPARLSEHAVGSFAHIDPRITFIAIEKVKSAVSNSVSILSVNAGTILDPQAVAWMLYVGGQTRAETVLCDHDRGIEHWRERLTFAEPVLYGVFDVDLMLQSRRPPPAILVSTAQLLSLADTEIRLDGPELRRLLTLKAADECAVAHIPRILATVMDIPRIAEGGIDSSEWPDASLRSPEVKPYRPWITRTGDHIGLCHREFCGTLTAMTQAVARAPDERLLVVIPTRDQPDLLRRSIDSLRFLARRPERIDYVIVDNRSVMSETANLLKQEQDRGATVICVDEPFNWSRLNNLAASSGHQPNLLFANNDVEMLTPGWDEILVQSLQRADVGTVGVRLLYPDATIQHAGILFVEGTAVVQHDGYRAPAGASGPNDRWITAHATSAVTGAFMAVRREIFDAVEGFDEKLFIGHSDIDFCLKVRETGKAVYYTPAIELVHYESATRGHNTGKDRVAWDQGELADLYARWGRSLQHDPGYNPQWAPGVDPFVTFREPPLNEILDWIELSVREWPWRPDRCA